MVSVVEHHALSGLCRVLSNPLSTFETAQLSELRTSHTHIHTHTFAITSASLLYQESPVSSCPRVMNNAMEVTHHAPSNLPNNDLSRCQDCGL